MQAETRHDEGGQGERKVAASIRLSLLILCPVLLLCSCKRGPDETPAADTSAGTPERIVSLAPNLTEILYALGVGDQLVGVSQYSNYPAQAAQKPRVGSFWQPNLEAVVAARPDLVVTLSFPQQQQMAERLAGLQCRSLMVQIESVEDLYSAIGRIGAATGRSAEAAQLIVSLQRRVQAIAEKAAAGDRPRVLWVVQRQPLRVAGTRTFANELIQLAGGVNAIEETLHQYPPIGPEQVHQARPEVIIEPAMLGESLEQLQRQAEQFWRSFETVPAARRGRIHVLDGDLVSRLGPRLDQGLAAVAACVHAGLEPVGDVSP